MPSIDQVSQSDRLLACLYDGVTDPAGFQAFVTALAADFRLKGVTLITLHPSTHDIKGLWLYGIELQWLERYALHYAAQDILAAHIMAAPIARFYASNLDLSADQFDLDSPFFKEWLIPQDIAFAAGAILLPEGDWLSQIFVQRGADQGPFERAELNQLNRLVPHMQRALQLRHRLAGLQLGEQMLTGWLDMLNMPTLLLDERGRVAYQNQRAADLFRSCAELSVKDGHLLAGNQTESRQLNVAITNAIAARWQPASMASAVARISRQRRQAPLMALITTIGQGNTGGALLFIFDPEQTPSVTRAALRKLFRFSEAEAALAAGLCAGFSLETMAIKREVSINTLKTQLKSLFSKTGVNRQSDLVAMLLTSPAYFLTLDGEPDEPHPNGR